MMIKTNTPGKVVLVDDEPNILLSFSAMLRSSGIENVLTINDSREVIPFLKKHSVELVILDLAMPFLPGEDLLVEISQDFPDVPVIVMTATNEIEKAVECMRSGAVDYLVKPVEKNRIISSVKRVLENRLLKKEVYKLKHHMLSDELENPGAFDHIITANNKMFSIFKYIEAIAGSSQPVVITGETGAGKELVARAIHLCAHSGGEFVAVNVAGLDDAMFSDTLFGHRKGAFTDASSSREGLIARAENGTLFLDEIGDLNAQSQVKLLRLIQECEYYTLGSDVPEKTNARLIAATNRNLEELMTKNTFRRDLFYRLCAHTIHVPPLRGRKEDIPLLLDYFLNKASETLEKEVPEPPHHLSTLLEAHDFPGNIRELEAMVYDAVSRHQTGPLSIESFRRIMGNGTSDEEHLTAEQTGQFSPDALERIFGRFPTLKQMETILTREALKRSEGNQGIAASLLGLTRQALNKRLSRKK